MNAPLSTAGRPCQLVLGLVLLLAGGTKIWQPLAFHWQVVSHVESLGLGDPKNTLARIAIVLGAGEWGLGLSLLLGFRPRQVIPTVTALGTIIRVWEHEAIPSVDDIRSVFAQSARVPAQATHGVEARGSAREQNKDSHE